MLRSFVSRTCLLYSCFIVSLAGCSLGDLVKSNDLPSDTNNPDAVKSPSGAMAAYYGALLGLEEAIGGSAGVGGYIITSGLLTDELVASVAVRDCTGCVFPSDGISLLDSRLEGNEGGDVFKALQSVRARTREARGVVRKYHPAASPAIIGHLFAAEGIAEVLLAELFCSGIPLSTLDFEGDFTLKPGSSTPDVYRHALTLFDSALVWGGDSVAIVHLTNLARARALLGLHDVASAAEAVAGVPTDFIYRLQYEGRPNAFQTNGNWQYSVGEDEGEAGLSYVSSGDPRTLSDSFISENDWSSWRVTPRKYLPEEESPAVNPGTVPIPFASGIEARLIEAEAALAAGQSTWLTMLNILRTSCTETDECPDPAPAGTAGVEGLPRLTDPGLETLPVGKTAHDVRIDLLFRERAFWLFLTGHRQGDLRRLVRQYQREPNTVYPSGLWGKMRMATYGFAINIPVPERERDLNPHYQGCFNRDE